MTTGAQRKQHFIGIFQILLSGFCFGFLGIWGKWAFQIGLTGGELLAARFTLAAAILLVYFIIRDRKFPWLGCKLTIISFLLGLFGYAVFASLYFYALQGVSASLTSLLLYTYPVFVAIGGSLFLNEPLGKRGVLSVFITMLGLVLLVWGDLRVDKVSSLIAGLMSGLTYTGYILVSRKYLNNVDSISSVFWMQLATGLSLALVHFHSTDRFLWVLTNGWPPILGIAVISSVFSMILFLLGLKKITSTEASIYGTAEPITAIIASSLILGEGLSLQQYLGGALVIASMCLIALRSPPKGHV